jgi:adenylate kinase
VAAGGDPPASDGDRRLILLGPPNSGKGTQAKVIAERLGVPAISTGDMLRRAVAQGSELGRRVESTLAAGRLVDDETMAELVEARLSCDDTAYGFLLDGYPRTLGQAKTLHRILEDCGDELDAAVHIRVPEEELVKRGLGRGRADDDEAVLRERLRVYREDTEPLVGYYEESGLLQEVDGDQPIDQVTSRIFAKLGVARGAQERNAKP